MCCTLFISSEILKILSLINRKVYASATDILALMVAGIRWVYMFLLVRAILELIYLINKQELQKNKCLTSAKGIVKFYGLFNLYLKANVAINSCMDK